uniref:Uncharacterized protein n=1 Tax=Oryza glaberrima TaxID=4538 RepID=I1P0D7_ORYGL
MHMLLEKLLLSPVHNDTYKFIRFQDEKISAYILSNKIKHESSSSQMESPQDIQSISKQQIIWYTTAHISFLN